jgi:hypothetical protein
MHSNLVDGLTTTRIRPIHIGGIGLTRPIAVSRLEGE